MTEFWSSDPHKGHFNIVKWRGLWETLEDMNRDLISRWNETVSPNDTVFLLGDMVMGKRAETLSLAQQLHGQIHLIPGNHDDTHPMHSKREEWYRKRVALYAEHGFEPNPERGIIERHGIRFGLCHFPFDADHTDELRYEEWRPVDWLENNEIDVLLHGHVHSLWKINRDHHIPQINVGMDVWDYRPITMEQIMELLNG
jgi:calcineurin-like phosphoesterase family protein